MRELIITGEHPLQGEVTVQGAKNSVLPILAATLLTSSQVELRGCPHLRDVEASVRILEALGCTARWEGENLVVDTAGILPKGEWPELGQTDERFPEHLKKDADEEERP